MNDERLICICQTCNKEMIVKKKDILENEDNYMYLTCMFNGKHKNINVINKFDNIEECMSQNSYKKVNGRTRQR